MKSKNKPVINSSKTVVTRFAPSPTGPLHLGSARTALFNYLFAKQHKGKFILRIEDTDEERSKKEYEEDIISGLCWLDLAYDEMFRQSERKKIYKKYIEKLIAKDKAYLSKEENREGKRREVVRFINPNIELKFNDLIRGEVRFDTTELKDFVIAKSLEEPLFHLAVVVDDFEMGISHVIRGEDHISNTPRQILIQKSLGFPETIYAHIPLILAPDRSKLSKRKHGQSVSLSYYMKQEIIPEALVNFLAMLGWNPGDDREILSMKDLISAFRLEKVQRGGAIFNQEKLEWLNGQYLKNMPHQKFEEKVQSYIKTHGKKEWGINQKVIKGIASVILERIKKISDIKEMIIQEELNYFFEKPELEKKKIRWKNSQSDMEAVNYLEKVIEIVKNLPDEDFNVKILKAEIMKYAEKEGRGAVLWPIRYALTGKEQSPDPFIVAEILNKQETLNRWQEAVKILKSQEK
jgi:glutamyl-tRNA synthetase